MLRRTPLAAIASLLPTAALPCTTDAMLVFDGSLSMVESGGAVTDLPRIAEARIATAQVLPEIETLRRVGLITYGPNSTDGCDGITQHFPPIPNAAAPMQDALDALAPAGLTALTASVVQAAETLNYRSDPGIVVLVTDGNETCGGTPCATSQSLAAQANDLTIHVIGFKFRPDFFAWDNPEQEYGAEMVARCLADQTGGLFVNTETVDELADALRATLGCLLIGDTTPFRDLLPA